MVFARLIPTVSLKDGHIIKTKRFDEYRNVGSPKTMGKVYDSQDVDELVFVDICATQESREPDWANIKVFADECSMPLTIGGGINKLEYIRKLLQLGADKVLINSHAVRHPEFVTEASNAFGSQCIIASIDAKLNGKGEYEVAITGGHEMTGLGVTQWAQELERRGAGEILITSIDRDGTMEGYDLKLIKSVVDAVGIPVIANGGAGLLHDLIEVIRETNCSAAACASIFAFTDNKPIKVKTFMQDHGIKIRPI